MTRAEIHPEPTTIPPASDPVLEVRDLHRWHRTRWGRKKATLCGVSFAVHPGEVFGLLGPNGAGKTTTLKILLGMLHPGAGTVRLFGRDARDVETRRRLGYLTEQPYYYDYLTAREFLDLCGVLCGLGRTERASRAVRLLEQVGLAADADVRLRRFSKGMLQRLGLAQALLHDPPLLILDEPMSGLDPLGRSLVRDLMFQLRQAGKTILFSSHILPDVETLCDRVAVLAAGRVVAEGRVTDLAAASDTGFEILAAGMPPALIDACALRGEFRRQAGERTLLEAADRAAMNRLVGEILSAGASIVGVTPRRSPLEAHFLAAVGGVPKAGAASLQDTVGATRTGTDG